MTIVSIDFETANYSRTSICAAGMAVFINGIMTETLYWLVRPHKGHGWFRDDFIECHHLNHLDVRGAPEFPGIAPELLERLTHSDLVITHNAEFDIGHLRGVLDHFGLAYPALKYLCTCRLARRVWPDLPDHRISTLAARIGHEFNHHQAKADAEAAGRVLLAMMEEVEITTEAELVEKTGIAVRRFTASAVAFGRSPHACKVH